MANIRDELNRADPNRLASIFNKLKIGDLINRLLGGSSTAVAATTVGSALGAFTDPPSAAEMAALRTFVNALRVDVLALRAALVLAGGATEAGVTVTANVATLAATPASLLVANVTAGSSTGMKQLLVGPITGPGAVVPLAGQAVWDGGVKVLFAIPDAATTATFMYTKGSDTTVSAMQAVVDTQ